MRSFSRSPPLQVPSACGSISSQLETTESSHPHLKTTESSPQPQRYARGARKREHRNGRPRTLAAPRARAHLDAVQRRGTGRHCAIRCVREFSTRNHGGQPRRIRSPSVCQRSAPRMRLMRQGLSTPPRDGGPEHERRAAAGRAARPRDCLTLQRCECREALARSQR